MALAQPGPELAWANRRHLAQQLGWPDGALEACEAIEKARPDWYPGWRAANLIKGFEQPAGFYGRRRAAPDREPPAYGADAAALLAAIEAVVSCCPACGLRYPVPPGDHIPVHELPGGRRCDVHWATTTVDASSSCPECGTTVDVPVRFDVPPHKDGRGEWCRARCSQRTA